MPVLAERRLTRLKYLGPEQSLTEGSALLSPERIALEAKKLYSWLDYLVHSPNSPQKIRPLERTWRDYRNDPRVHESHLLRLKSGDTTEIYNRLAENPGLLSREMKAAKIRNVPGIRSDSTKRPGFPQDSVNLLKKTPDFQSGEVYTFLFGDENSLALCRWVPSPSGQKTEEMIVAARGERSFISHQSQGIYGKETEEIAEENSTTAAARSEILVSRLNKLWLLRLQGFNNLRKNPVEDVQFAAGDLFLQLKELTDLSKNPQVAGFKTENIGSDIISLDLGSRDGEYDDHYSIEVGRNVNIAIITRYKTQGFDSLDSEPWERLSVSLEGVGPGQSGIRYESCGIKGYGALGKATEVTGFQAWVRGYKLLLRFKEDFARNSGLVPARIQLF